MTNEAMATMIRSGKTELIPILWERVRKLVAKFTCNYYRRHYDLCRHAGVTDEDLLQEAYFGFIKAIHSYPPESGNKFTSYLNFPIQSCFALITGQRTSKSREEPLNHAASLSVPVADTVDICLQDTLPDEYAYLDFEQIEIADIQRTVRESVAQLKDIRQREFIARYFLHKRSYQSIANEYSISNKQVQQIIYKGLRELRCNKQLRILNDEFCSHNQTRFLRLIEYSPEYFDLVNAIRERQKREYISYGKQQVMLYELKTKLLQSERHSAS